MRLTQILLLIALSLPVAAPGQQKRLGSIDFFGSEGLDIEAVRSALPFREGDAFPATAAQTEWEMAVKDAAIRVTGRDATDVAMVCCDSNGDWMIYVGLAGRSAGTVRYRPAPNGGSRLPSDLVRLDSEIDDAWFEAVQKGNTREERSTGYVLSTDPALRSRQLALRRLALQHEKRIIQVLSTSSDGKQRAIAASALGYARQTNAQLEALIRAGYDSDSAVRNNAVRAIGVLVAAKPMLRRKVPASVFVDLVRSGYWTDRNKGSFLLMELTKQRDPQVLAELRLKALVPLIEMARWRESGHAYPARVLLGRIGGIPEARLLELVRDGQVDTIVRALRIKP